MSALVKIFTHPKVAAFSWPLLFISVGSAILLATFPALGCRCGPMALWPLFGLLNLGVGVLALANQLAVRFWKSRAPGQDAVARGNLAMVLTGAIWAALCLGVAGHELVGSGPALQTIAGRPVEMRTAPSVKVRMTPGGPFYIYGCGRRYGYGRCQNLDALQALGRWPQPEFVQMQVRGDKIFGLTMDGRTYIESGPHLRREKVIHAVIALAAGGLLAFLLILAALGVKAMRSAPGRPRSAMS